VATADGIKLVSEEFSGNFSYGTATIAAAGADRSATSEDGRTTPVLSTCFGCQAHGGSQSQ
jgi:hypothetical protein